ncbi:CbtB domain-containing protein [Yoonia sp.]|jgi:cobalt transporter subunit CbtB|uniref:CbtB domain-containing protein n=1 Tax=Yoonia sp. TaxID=2212373 RepID=UPI0025D34F31|nr:CbtB domain-containing protein [Yoonia sp.]
MKTQTKAIYAAQTKINTNILSLIAVAFIGIGIIAVAGHVQAATLHDAAHDMRHATGFPCH